MTAKQVEGAWDQNFREWHESTEQAKGKKWYDTLIYKMSKGVSGFTSNILSQEINAMNIYPWFYENSILQQ